MKVSAKITAWILSAILIWGVIIPAWAIDVPYTDTDTIQTASKIIEYDFTMGVGQAILLEKKLSVSSMAKYVSHNPTVATVNAKGKLSAKSVGNADITVETTDGNTICCHITVKSTPETVALPKTKMNMGIGQVYSFKTTLSPSDSVTYLSWSSNRTSVATVTNGIVTAKKKGQADITVKTSNGKTAVCTVNVKSAPDKILLDKYGITLDMGQSYTLTKTLSPANTFASYVWKSTDTSVVTVNSTGKITAKKAGVAYVTVTTHNGKTATCQVMVNRPKAESISFEQEKVSIFQGETLFLTTNIMPANADKMVSWKSSNPSVASVVRSGKITGVSMGSAVITVTTASGKTATCCVHVKEPYADSVIRLVNEARVRAGVHPLEKREDVAALAQIRAEEISSRFSHIRPNGQFYETIFTEYGISYNLINENIAAGFTTPESTVEAWLESSGHKRYMLSPLYNATGTGVYEKNGQLYWVQLFIR